MTPEQADYVDKFSDEIAEIQRLIWRLQSHLSVQKGDTALTAAQILIRSYDLIGIVSHRMLTQIAQDNTGGENA